MNRRTACSRVLMIEVPVTASVDLALGECLRRGLEVRSERGLAGRPGSRHYHLADPARPGTLELSEWRGEVWFSINERRDCGWVSDFAQTVAAAIAQLPDPR
ncbi:MAG TPA: hypothetical protein VGI64_23710 [Streptosporangiaceae bacterium]|jgi:hypothetical protein